ncbi:MAG: FAD-binding oxidoreductase [Gammaproteobacteria bacterium]|nr:FAD-binding oxidoreductase [Gammaproteobacteria bacterium]
MEPVDVCIIGGGMAGASVAFNLAPHASVLLLERERHAGYHSTGRSAALYAPNYCSALVQRLTLAGRTFLDAPPPGFASAPLLRARGYLLIGDDARRAARDQYEREARAAGLDTARLPRPEALALVPVLRPAAFDWALFDPNAWDLDVDALLQGCLRGARAHGARVLTSHEVLGFGPERPGWRVVGRDFEVRARVVVNAAGAWADELAALAGLAPLRLVPHRRTAFTFDPPPGHDSARWPMVADADERFYFKPDAGRMLGSLGEGRPSPPVDAQPEDLDVAVAVHRIEQVVDFNVQRVLHSWTGLRVFGPDRDPVSGFAADAPGFYWHAGLGGYGIQTAPALGAFAAANILARELPATLRGQGIEGAQLAPQRLRP